MLPYHVNATNPPASRLTGNGRMEAIRDVAVHYSGLAVPNGDEDSKFRRGLRVKAALHCAVTDLIFRLRGRRNQ